MNITITVGLAILILMVVGWLLHIAVDWHWDFKAWYHDSDDDI